MDFVMELSLFALKRNVIWVIVDQLVRFTQFLPIRDTLNVERLANYIIERDFN